MIDYYVKTTRPYQILNTIAFIITIFVNGLANALPLNGKTTGEISEIYFNLFTPAAITFTIWGLIYLGLGVFIIYQLGFLTRQGKDHLHIVSRIGWHFVIASLANVGWIFTWHYQQVLLSVLMMLILLKSLIDIYGNINDKKPSNTIEKIGVQWVFSIYLSWISVATIANIMAFLTSINWNGFGIPPQIWTMAAILLATMITLKVIFHQKDIPYALVIQWAFVGILIKHMTFFASAYKGIITITIFCILLIFASILSIPRQFQTQRN